MKIGGDDESINKFGNRKMNIREVFMKYGRLAVFIRQDSVEI
jgi:hypothetical protein